MIQVLGQNFVGITIRIDQLIYIADGASGMSRWISLSSLQPTFLHASRWTKGWLVRRYHEELLSLELHVDMQKVIKIMHIVHIRPSIRISSFLRKKAA